MVSRTENGGGLIEAPVKKIKRWAVGDHAFYYNPLTEDIVEVEVIGVNFHKYPPKVHIISLSGDYEWEVYPNEILNERIENNDE